MTIVKKETYTDTGDKAMISLGEGSINKDTLFTVKCGSADTYSIKIQMTKDSQIVTPKKYKNVSGEDVGRAPSDCYAIGINISANSSGSIIFETFTK